MDFDKLPNWRIAIFVFTSLPLVIAGRVMWQNYPGIWTCLLFWALSLPDDPLRFAEMGFRRRSLYAMAWLGAIGNAVATIANGGYMPVLNRSMAFEEGSLWIPMTDAARFQWLCDIYPVGIGTCSLGDLFIFTALTGMLLNWLLEQVDILDVESIANNKRLPGMGL